MEGSEQRNEKKKEEEDDEERVLDQQVRALKELCPSLPPAIEDEDAILLLSFVRTLPLRVPSCGVNSCVPCLLIEDPASLKPVLFTLLSMVGDFTGKRIEAQNALPPDELDNPSEDDSGASGDEPETDVTFEGDYEYEYEYYSGDERECVDGFVEDYSEDSTSEAEVLGRRSKRRKGSRNSSSTKGRKQSKRSASSVPASKTVPDPEPEPENDAIEPDLVDVDDYLDPLLNPIARQTMGGANGGGPRVDMRGPTRNEVVEIFTRLLILSDGTCADDPQAPLYLVRAVFLWGATTFACFSDLVCGSCCHYKHGRRYFVSAWIYALSAMIKDMHVTTTDSETILDALNNMVDTMLSLYQCGNTEDTGIQLCLATIETSPQNNQSDDSTIQDPKHPYPLTEEQLVMSKIIPTEAENMSGTEKTALPTKETGYNGTTMVGAVQ